MVCTTHNGVTSRLVHVFSTLWRLTIGVLSTPPLIASAKCTLRCDAHTKGLPLMYGVSCTPRDGKCVENTSLGGAYGTPKLSSVW